ncbi:MAG: 2-succinyl-5-enolpyruvyl-6-hydroxy-3-cyclohexene-1-carboxylic-acid synthase [Gemmatimonadota bacterium]
MSYADLQAVWAELLIDALGASGIRQAVVSPGSRSTPLVLAMRRAESEGRLEATVIADERVAGFFALGHGRVTGEAALLVCTSGTAAAHYFPALIEASQSGVPLVVLTADRPPELMARGANQTIDQSHLFGRWVRESLDIGLPDPDTRAWDGLPRTAARIVQASLLPDPGPVHLNVRFRKPLQPTASDPSEISTLRSRAKAVLADGLPVPRHPNPVPDPADLDSLAARVRRARRGVLFAGPMPLTGAVSAATVSRFLERSGFVLAPEATSQLRFGGGAPRRLLLDAFEPIFGRGGRHDDLDPDFVLQIGGAPTGRGVGGWLASDRAPERVVVASRGYPEAFNRASEVWITDPGLALMGLAERLDGIAPEADWAGRARAASDRVWDHLDEMLSHDGGFSEPAAVRTAVGAVPAGGLLALGNSLPVREADLFCPASERSIAVLSQRGASGIDGAISAAAGAVAASGFPGLLLTGDVGFQHDVGGLAAARELSGSLAIVVLCNGGGRLFDLLPVRDLLSDDPAVFSRFFHTPPVLSPMEAATAFGVRGVAVESTVQLSDSIAEALARPGATVIEARLEGSPASEWVRRLAQSVAGE